MGGLTRNKLKQMMKSVFRVRTWKLILILIPLMFLGATLLRFDHLGMVELKDKVLEADKNGTEEEITVALLALKEYTLTHVVVNVIEENGEERIIFGTGQFYLEQQYVRTAKAELARAEAALEGAGENPNGNIFQKAAQTCDALALRYGWGFSKPYIDCMTRELDKFPSMDAIEDYKQAMIPPTALYRRNFASPLWRPDATGFVVLTCLILIVAILIRLIIWITLRIALVLMKKK